MADLYPNHLLKSMEHMEEDDVTDDEIEQTFKTTRLLESSASNEKPVLSSMSDILDLPWSTWAVNGIIICFFACSMYFVLGTSRMSCSASFDDVEYHLESLKTKFPSQDASLWAGIISVLRNLIKKPVEPAVYLVTFDEDSIGTSSCIAEAITTLATKLLQPCESETRKWLLLNGTLLSKSSTTDPGYLIDAITKEKEHSQIVIVPDIQKVPAKLAKGFHSLVDTYGAMAKRRAAVYIFTLMIPRLDDSSTITRVVEDILLQTWKELDKDELQPLVTRISHFILPVTKEDGAQFCPLKIESTIDVKIP